MASISKKARSIDVEQLYDLLLGARTAESVTLHFKDGRVLKGALVFNQFKGTGRLINVDQEMSEDFSVDELRDLKY
ncbi:MAG: hypothetical protein GC161_00760 [Planctomycetaceae bacterium]|nr:hypothetical protein [Planctomycetaceae bacterium]